MNGILSDTTIEKFKTIRKVLLRISVWVFIGAIAFSVLLILVGGSTKEVGEAIAKTMGTLFTLALMMMVSVNNFKRLETDKAGVQSFALLGFITNILWAALWIMAIWGVFDIWTSHCSYCNRSVSVLGKFTFIITDLSILGFLASNILSIREGDRGKTVTPLKITAVACLAYEGIFSIMTIILDGKVEERMAMLAAFTGFIWIVATAVALVLSAGAKKQDPSNPQMMNAQGSPAVVPGVLANSNSTPVKSEEELRAEIEQKVRAEMIEKEVREKMQQEQNNSPENSSTDKN